MKKFIRTLTSVPISFYALALPTSVVWCLILGIIDNELDTSKSFLERYLDPLMWLWYGLPVFVSMLWLMSIALRRNYGFWQSTTWTIPLGCLLGTTFALIAFVIVLGFMKLIGLA